MVTRIALVQGASRGIGLEFAKQLLQRPGYKVIGTCRSDPESISALVDLQKQSAGSFLPVQLDCTREESVKDAYNWIKNEVSHLNLLLNVSGVLHNTDGLFPEKTFRDLSSDNMMTSYLVNAMGPAFVMKHFSELLVQAEKHGNASSQQPAVVANMSARVSSIGDNFLGGWYSYRASKTALNQLTKCVALELGRRKKKVACILLHPGTVETDLSKPFQKNVPEGKLFSKEFAVGKLLQVIDQATIDSNGKFFAWDGSEIQW